jgi:hypothetical protein
LVSLSDDYSAVLAGIRSAMVNSDTDRPDLAAALLKNQSFFAFAMCRIEYRLFLVRFGIGSVDLSQLVEGISALQAQARMLNPAMAASV